MPYPGLHGNWYRHKHFSYRTNVSVVTDVLVFSYNPLAQTGRRRAAQKDGQSIHRILEADGTRFEIIPLVFRGNVRRLRIDAGIDLPAHHSVYRVHIRAHRNPVTQRSQQRNGFYIICSVGLNVYFAGIDTKILVFNIINSSPKP